MLTCESCLLRPATRSVPFRSEPWLEPFAVCECCYLPNLTRRGRLVLHAGFGVLLSVAAAVGFLTGSWNWYGA